MRRINCYTHSLQPTVTQKKNFRQLLSAALALPSLASLALFPTLNFAASLAAEVNVKESVPNIASYAPTESLQPKDIAAKLSPSSNTSLSTTSLPELIEEASTIKLVAGKILDTAQGLAIYALGLVGVNYKFGGNNPDAGLDCSGLVRHVFQQVTGITLPRSAKEMSRLGEKITLENLKPGDLVFFNTRHFQFSHVGIYLGDNRFIHAPASGGDVELMKITEPYWAKTFNGARRLIGVLTDEETTQVLALRAQVNNATIK